MKEHIRNIPNFPKPGVQFKDITPILQDSILFKQAIDWFCSIIKQYPHVKKIAAIESRGFIFASAICNALNLGLVLIRKKGKLPHDTYSVSYDLEYGEGTLEIHKDAFQPKEEIILVDDLLATGGTAHASIDLIHKAKGIPVACIFFIELAFLKGKDKLNRNLPNENIHYHFSF